MYLKVLSPVLAHTDCSTSGSSRKHQQQRCPEMGFNGEVMSSPSGEVFGSRLNGYWVGIL